ncbi:MULTISPECIES: succinate dehydrogenase, hydrophobic membrane anchor protein [Gulbenkiania]|uniref:Succinate dehydrogenase hydrophobic membrane anchor subunit n=2 Tax=Gulbenkiania TaxID=397456 RepID=A0A0K6H654_9NEIS|nr:MULTISPECIES: succinate dehydrogenase, hydrophobic membrane anchor protein [Gulbenkiania]TCW33680.1 succinate dehydrogenase / fumarate reductase membrane anchor subunit [Gulbenkiania mobilis]CUA86470.1 succinate dehydrogenase, hydrophobic membrane anchor protein [Gulbenkiania indica]
MVNRIVVGAHYGVRDWIMQRITAVLMLVYAVALVLFVLALPSGYESWKALFSQGWVRILTVITYLGVVLHAWVGMRDVWMDYIKPAGIRLTMHVLTILWLTGCFFYSIKVVWGL